MDDAMKLLTRLEEQTGEDIVDHLGKYYLWLSRHGIEPETEWGWFTKEVFEEENINAYCNDFNNRHIY